VKAKQLLGTKDAQVTERLFFKQKPTEDEVRALAAKLPGGARDLLSTRSRRYKELGLADKQLSEAELIPLLAQEPGLWRRPVVIRGDEVVIGYDAPKLESLLS
jgi:arsenate reductase-like glutaredoxin family protein